MEKIMDLPTQISVIIPLYNAEKFITDTLKSILQQSFTDFEVIVVNDGSTDNSIEKVKEFKDSRIIIIEKKENSGIVDTLNIGIKAAKGDFIARMDADDIAYNNRFKVQYEYLKNNPNIAVVGSFQDNFGIENKLVKLYQTNALIKTGLVFNNQICHPSVMINRDLVQKEDLVYKREFQLAEDWVLWFDLSTKGYKMHNLPTPLIKYRIEGQNTTAKHRNDEKARHYKVYKYILNQLSIQPNNETLDLHWAMARANVSQIDLNKLKPYFKVIEEALKNGGYEKNAITKILRAKKEKIFFDIADYSPQKALSYIITNGLISFSKVKYLITSSIKSKN
ncbi:MAG: glycosyltransferase family 2 protein [Crocinitomicaceae bacterium]